MLALLVVIRDLLIAAALAWAGVSIDFRPQNEQTCVQGDCDAQGDD
jgi:hypothetical protein